jgi:hypothetical protein
MPGTRLDLREVVRRVAVQHELAHLDQGVVGVRPHLGQVERVEAVRRGVRVGHHLDVQRPRRELAALDGVPQVGAVRVGVLAGDLRGLLRGQGLDALVGLEVVLHPEALAGGVLPQVRVRAVAVLVAPRLRDAPVAHQPRHLVRGLRLQRPEVPLHVVVAAAGVGAALLRADEVRELDRVAQEEHRRVVADDVVVALRRVELQRETARVTPGVGRAELTGDGGEAQQRLGLDVGLEQGRFGEAADVLGRLEVAEGTATLGVHDPLGHPLPVELGVLLDQVVVLQQDRAVGAEGQRVVVARDRDACVVGGGTRFGHAGSSF